MTGVVLAIDIGGTKTTAALVDRNGRLRDSATAATPAAQGPDAVVATIAELANGLVGRSSADTTIRGVGVGTAGVVDVNTGSIVSSTDTMTDWAGTELASRIRLSLREIVAPDVVVHVQNDVDAHAVGELRYGAARGAMSTLVVAVGTGVGSGIVIDGHVLRGAHNVAGEIAHVPIPGAEHLRCPCGRFGHLEAIGSGVGMHRHYLALGGSAAVTDARAIVTAAGTGDELAARALNDSARAVGKALAAAVTLLDPERVVITGGVANIGDEWWKPMELAFHEEVIDALQATPVIPGQLGAAAPLLGAAASVWDTVEAQE
ncbi:MAG: ROK family protein [Rhodoglobus sp.]